MNLFRCFSPFGRLKEISASFSLPNNSQLLGEFESQAQHYSRLAIRISNEMILMNCASSVGFSLIIYKRLRVKIQVARNGPFLNISKRKIEFDNHIDH